MPQEGRQCCCRRRADECCALQLVALAVSDLTPSVELSAALRTAEATLRWVEGSAGVVKDWIQAELGIPPPTPAQAYRLPTALRPLEYQLSLQPHLQLGTFQGQVAISVQVAQRTKVIALHSAGLNFTAKDVAVQGPAGRAAEVRSLQLDSEHLQVHLRLDSALRPGSYVLSVKYSGLLRRDLRGFYLTTRSTERGPA